MVRLVFWLVCACLVSSVGAETLTLPSGKRPLWLEREGIVMAGSWEPLLFRVRRDGAKGYEPTPEQAAGYAREHSPEMVAQLKSLGVNFVMMHAYKGFGLNSERESMADAVRFARLCHEEGLRVGVYNYSGAFGWELFFQEHPEARDWLVLDESARPVAYDSSAQYRYFWNRTHPEAQAFYKGLVRFAVRDIGSDLIHFDNYNVGPGFDTCSVRQFRQYLRKTFSRAELRAAGVHDLGTVFPPGSRSADNLLRRAWQDFSCQSLADSYHEMARYARRLRSDVLVECNPNGAGESIRPPVDHGRILSGGEAFWDEDVPPGYRNGVLQTRIRTYKVGRVFNNIAFAYTTTPLEAAEAMAFNLDCLGCICWFEYGKLVARPGSSQPVSTNLGPFVRFYTAHRDLFRRTAVVADVAVLRSFPSQVFAEPRCAQLTWAVEQALIERRVPFQIIYGEQLTALSQYRVVVLAGCPALSNPQVKLLERYVAAGGRLCIIGLAGTHDEWLRPRPEAALQGLGAGRYTLSPGEAGSPNGPQTRRFRRNRPATLSGSAGRAFRFEETEDVISAVRRSCGGQLSFTAEAPTGLCAELTQQAGRRLLHLVNYQPDRPVTNAVFYVSVPHGQRAIGVDLVSPEHDALLELAFEAHEDSISFTVPKVNVYEIAVVRFR